MYNQEFGVRICGRQHSHRDLEKLMKHNELNELWRMQRQKDQKWHLQLVGSAYSLRNAVREILKPDPPVWQDFNTKANNEYVEVVDFYGLDKTRRGDLRDLQATSVGILVYGLAVTFDHGPGSYPKQDIFIPIASRLIGSNAEYALFDREKNSPDNHWENDAHAFASKLIDRFKEYLSHNAYDGFDKRQKFDFI